MTTAQTTQAEEIAECVTAMRKWRNSVRELNRMPSPEARHYERECYRYLDSFPEEIQKLAQMALIGGAR